MRNPSAFRGSRFLIALSLLTGCMSPAYVPGLAPASDRIRMTAAPGEANAAAVLLRPGRLATCRLPQATPGRAVVKPGESGRILLSSGDLLEIPAGAVTAETEFVMARGRGRDRDRLEITGGSFTGALVLHMTTRGCEALKPGEEFRVVYLAEGLPAETLGVPSSDAEGRITVRLTHLSAYALAVPQ